MSYSNGPHALWSSLDDRREGIAAVSSQCILPDVSGYTDCTVQDTWSRVISVTPLNRRSWIQTPAWAKCFFGLPIQLARCYLCNSLPPLPFSIWIVLEGVAFPIIVIYPIPTSPIWINFLVWECYVWTILLLTLTPKDSRYHHRALTLGVVDR